MARVQVNHHHKAKVLARSLALVLVMALLVLVRVHLPLLPRLPLLPPAPELLPLLLPPWRPRKRERALRPQQPPLQEQLRVPLPLLAPLQPLERLRRLPVRVRDLVPPLRSLVLG